MSDFILDVTDKYGEDVISQVEERDVDVIPTGSLSLDISLGVGGIPRGRFIEVYGPESSGKTTLLLGSCREANRLGIKVLYIDVEQGLDYNYIEAVLGDVNPEMFIIAQPEYAEDALEIAEMAINSGEFGMIVLDSVGALAPRKEKEDDLTDSNVAIIPRLLTKFLRRNAFTVRKNNIAFVYINQVRDKIGSYISMFVTPGGHALSHYISMKVRLLRSDKIKQGEDIIGLNAKYTIEKNKLAPPFRSFYIPIVFGEGVDHVMDVVNFSEMLGVLKKRGAYYKLGDETIGQGLVKTVDALRNDANTLDKIVEMCYNALGSERKNGKVE